MQAMERAARIRLIIFDVDGVMTDGKIMIGNQGELVKSFNAHDGLGIALLRLSGVKTAVITGRTSDIVRLRCGELSIDDVHQGEKDKVRALRVLQEKYQLKFEEIAYVGDDLMDIPVMQRVGFACAVKNAVREVKRTAHFISDYSGGGGGIRQIAELILSAQGKWDAVVASYINQKPLQDIAQ